MWCFPEKHLCQVVLFTLTDAVTQAVISSSNLNYSCWNISNLEFSFRYLLCQLAALPPPPVLISLYRRGQCKVIGARASQIANQQLFPWKEINKKNCSDLHDFLEAFMHFRTMKRIICTNREIIT
jgi:hypothetical protein